MAKQVLFLVKKNINAFRFGIWLFHNGSQNCQFDEKNKWDLQES